METKLVVINAIYQVSRVLKLNLDLLKVEFFTKEPSETRQNVLGLLFLKKYKRAGREKIHIFTPACVMHTHIVRAA